MTQKRSLSVVFPAFNEEELIEKMVRHTVSALDNLDLLKWEIVVVDDGSKDRTGDILKRLSKEYKGLRVLTHEKNKGYANALKTGLNNAKYSMVFYTDSDLQFDLNELKLLLEKIDDYDIVCGYRAKRADSKHRLITSHVYNWLLNIFFRLDIKDVDCSFKLFNKKVLDDIRIESNSFVVDLEIMYKAKKKGFTISEVPVTHRHRTAGSSTVTIISIFKTIMATFWLKKRIDCMKK